MQDLRKTNPFERLDSMEDESGDTGTYHGAKKGLFCVSPKMVREYSVDITILLINVQLLNVFQSD